MPLSALLFLFVPAVSFKLSADCSGFFSRENACNSLVLEVLQEWPKHKPIPSLKAAGSIASMCLDALKCTKTLDCSEKREVIEEKVKDLEVLYNGIQTFAGPFGQCLHTIRTIATTNEYPCLVYWENQDQSPTCEFFMEDYECAKMVVENQCGTSALKEMGKYIGFLKEHFECSERTPQTVFIAMFHK